MTKFAQIHQTVLILCAALATHSENQDDQEKFRILTDLSSEYIIHWAYHRCYFATTSAPSQLVLNLNLQGNVYQCLAQCYNADTSIRIYSGQITNRSRFGILWQLMLLITFNLIQVPNGSLNYFFNLRVIFVARELKCPGTKMSPPDKGIFWYVLGCSSRTVSIVIDLKKTSW